MSKFFQTTPNHPSRERPKDRIAQNFANSRIPSGPSAAPVGPQGITALPEQQVLSAPRADAGSGFSVFALCVLLYMAFGRATDFYLDGLHLPFAISMVCLVSAIATRGLFLVVQSKIGQMFALFTVWLVACIPFSVWPGGSFDTVTNTWFKSFALFVVTGALLRSSADCTKTLVILAWSFLTAALLAFVWGEDYGGRFGLVQGLYSGANELAAAMVQGFVFWWFMIHRSTKSMAFRFLSVIPLVPMFYVLTKSASRGGFLVLAVIALVLLFYYRGASRVIYIGILATALFVSVFALPQTARLRLMTIFTSDVSTSPTDAESTSQVEMSVGSSIQRFKLLKTSLELTIRHPLFGVGPGQFAVAEDQNARALNARRGAWLGTHNTYTQISSESGLPGILFFGASIIFCWRELRAVERHCRKFKEPYAKELRLTAYTLRLALISYIVFFCVEHIGYDPFYPALAGVIAALSRITRQQLQAVPDTHSSSNLSKVLAT